MTDRENIDESALEALEEVADVLGVPVDRLLNELPAVGVDVEEITAEQGERMVDALESGDVEKYEEVLEDIGVEEPFRQQILDSIEERIDEIAGGDDSETPTVDDDRDDYVVSDGDDDTDTSSASGGGMTRAEVREMVRKETPDADDIAAQLKSQMGGAGGGDSGGMNEQQRMALEIAKQYLTPDTSGPMQEVQEAQQQMQQRLVENMAQKMAQPSLGERIGQGIEEALAEEVVSNMEISIGGEDINVDPDTDAGKEAATDGGKKESDE